MNQNEATRLGLTKYLTGRPCRSGHIAERYTSNAGCVECQRLRNDDMVKNRSTLRGQLGLVSYTIRIPRDGVPLIDALAESLIAEHLAKAISVPVVLPALIQMKHDEGVMQDPTAVFEAGRTYVGLPLEADRRVADRLWAEHDAKRKR